MSDYVLMAVIDNLRVLAVDFLCTLAVARVSYGYSIVQLCSFA